MCNYISTDDDDSNNKYNNKNNNDEKKIPLINFTATEQQYLLSNGAISASDQ